LAPLLAQYASHSSSNAIDSIFGSSSDDDDDKWTLT
jgi:hypothetical protein